jgi:uncharacterized protein (TIGR00266 family)
MNIEILYRPSYSMGLVHLEGNEEVRGGWLDGWNEPGMVLETAATGGFIRSFARSVLGGSFFQNTYKAPPTGGTLYVAPPLPGDLFVVDMVNESLLVQSGSFVASEINLQLDTRWSGAKTFFASEGLIMLRTAGSGKLLLSSYGAIHDIDLGTNQTITIDTGHLVAFDDRIGFQVRAVGGLKSTLFSGKGWSSI